MLTKDIHKNMKKTTQEVKRYGKRYGKRGLLFYGDIKMIQQLTGRSYINVVQQLGGYRTMQSDVRAAVESITSKNKEQLEKIKEAALQ